MPETFAGPYYLAQNTGVQVVPVAPFYEFGSKDIYMNVGNPIDLTQYENKNEALTVLRDNIATLVYENIEKHASHLTRCEMGSDPRMDYMEQRRLEYLKNKWHRDVWKEELTVYLSPKERELQAISESMDKIVITKYNAAIMAPILNRQIEEKRYDFLAYMEANWDQA